MSAPMGGPANGPASTRPRVAAATLVRNGRPLATAPGWRFELSEAQWAELAERLHTDPLPLAGLWSDGEAVHALFLQSPDAPLVASVRVENKRVLALSPSRRHAAGWERILRDLWGIEAMEALDLRPWLDHGAWTQTAPLSARPGPAAWPPEPPEFVWDTADEAAGAMQWPIGPVQSLVFGPAQIRVTVVGERIRRLEPLLGFAHRGVARSLRGLTPADAAPLVGRIDATACVAYQSAFARAVEAAVGRPADGATRSLRLAMGALERIGLLLRRSEALVLRAVLLDACASAFGHRLMRGSIVPGGWAFVPDEAGLGAVQDVLSRIEATFVGTGVGNNIEAVAGASVESATLRRDLADARRGLAVTLPERVPPVPVSGSGEGLAVADSTRGQVWHWVRLDNGRIDAWHAVDPTLPLLLDLAEQARGRSLDELPSLFASYDLAVAGADQ